MELFHFVRSKARVAGLAVIARAEMATVRVDSAWPIVAATNRMRKWNGIDFVVEITVYIGVECEVTRVAGINVLVDGGVFVFCQNILLRPLLDP